MLIAMYRLLRALVAIFTGDNTGDSSTDDHRLLSRALELGWRRRVIAVLAFSVLKILLSTPQRSFELIVELTNFIVRRYRHGIIV
jgi:hypothetical protein